MISIFAFPLPGGLKFHNPLVDNLMPGEPVHIVDIGSAISRALPYLLIFSGIILLGMLIAGGFAIMTALGNEEKMQNGKTRITHALIGFMALFGVYWLAQIAQILFKIPIL